MIVLDSDSTANGSLFLDDGIQVSLNNVSLVKFEVKSQLLSSYVSQNSYKPSSAGVLGSIEVWGLRGADECDECAGILSVGDEKLSVIGQVHFQSDEFIKVSFSS